MDISPIISSLQRALRRLLRSRGQTPEDTEDLIQEAFLRLHAFMNEGRVVREPEAFMVRTALNLAVDAHRHHGSDSYTALDFDELDLVDPSPSAEEQFAAEQRLRAVRKLLETALSTESCEVYLQHRLDGFTYEEIAKRMRMSARTVEYHIAQATHVLAHYRQREKMPKGEPE